MRAEADQLGEIERLRSELQEVRASRLRLALAADAERSSIEGSLHDGVLQGLAGLAAGLELAARSVEEDPAAATRLLVEMRADLRLAMKETRELAHRIYPPLLDAGGLGS